MDARDDILGRLRRALGRDAENRAAARADVQTAFAERAHGPRPALGADLAAHFCREAERMASTIAVVADYEEVPAAVARYLVESGLPPRGVAWPKLATLDWAAAGLAVEPRPVRADDPVGITGCFCAIAETGTLMCCSGAETPAATSLLPETHVAVLPASRIVAGMEEAWALARRELGVLPRAVNFISGPSRTGDIEMSIVLGAHGPARVHIVLVREA